MPSLDSCPPLGLYIHIPWCLSKCPYCDFNSHQLNGTLPEIAYVDALLADFELEREQIAGRKLETIFLGGGTPSLLSADAIARLLAGIRSSGGLSEQAEITLEANPGAAEAGRFAEYKEAGITRLSIGVQSFDDGLLGRLARAHSAKEAIAAAEAAHTAGLDNFNLDLMFALPGQDLAAAQRDIKLAVSLNPAHMSYYQLTLEPNTAYYQNPPALPDDELAWEIQRQGQRLLIEAGFSQYEISAYSRPGSRCQHNLNYWRFGDYLGIGAGAHSKITQPELRRASRWSKSRHPNDYLRLAGSSAVRCGQQVLEEADLILEFMMNLLRLEEGFTPELFAQRCGLAYDRIKGFISVAMTRGWMEMEGETLKPTEMGHRYLNDLLSLFVKEV